MAATRSEPAVTVLGPKPARIRQLLSWPGDSQELPAHPGLIFDRYLPLWNEDGNIPERQLSQALHAFAQRYANPSQDAREQLKERLQRMERLAELRGGFQGDIILETPMALGLGQDHPSGNGFSFDPVLGLPLLPGSAVKGICRRGAESMGADPAKITNRLGPAAQSNQTDTGDLVFLDACPAHWPRLEVQIINPHQVGYQRWIATLGNSCGRKKRSSDRNRKHRRPDWKDSPHGLNHPTPIYHLSVAAGTPYRFIFWSRSGHAKAMAETETWLREALAYLGAGERTAVGLGLFQPPPG